MTMAGNDGVSIIVCCYNSVSRLPGTLQHIARQKVSAHIPWEVVVIDNASTDATGEAARLEWEKTASKAPFRVVEQQEPGLSAAREKGVEESRYEFMIFCDDDNWLCEDYVENAHKIMHDDPLIGVLGGQGETESEIIPPKWYEKYFLYYAVGPQGDRSGNVTNTKGYVYGAGFVVRRSAWLKLRQAGFTSQLTGRKGDSLSSSEDRELCYALRLLGYKIWYHEKLTFKHSISIGRLEWSYFLRLVETAHRTIPQMDAYMAVLNGEMITQSLRWYWLRQCSAILRQLIKNPKFFISVVRGGEGSRAVVQWHRMRGELYGWWSVGGNFVQLYETVRQLQAARDRGQGDNKFITDVQETGV